MNQQDIAHAWWSRLRHQGLLLSPVVLLERLESAPPVVPFYVTGKLRDAYTRFSATIDTTRENQDLDESAVVAWTDALLAGYVGHGGDRIAKQNSIPDKLTAVVRIGTKSDTIRPHRVIFADGAGTIPAMLVMADTSPHVGRGRGRTVYSRFIELLRGTGHRVGLLTNGLQVRLVYAGLDFESWSEWETERWFDDGEGTEELRGLRQLLSPESLAPTKDGTTGLLDAIEESRKKQADLSSVLRENVRQAVESLMEEVSAANRTTPDLFNALCTAPEGRTLSDAEAHEALLQATVRVVMRLVVCLFSESRGLLPVNDPVYAQSYGVRSLYELLDESHREEGGIYGLLNRRMAWPRLMALFRLIHRGSAHGSFPFKSYSGLLFRPGDDKHEDAVSRALHILEHRVPVCDATIYRVLQRLLRGPLPVMRGRTKTFVEGPVDYTDLRTEFIGLIYEGLLDYRLKRTDEKVGPQVFLNIGREPVLPLYRLEDMLKTDPKGLKDLLTTLRKEKATATAAAEEEEPAADDAEAMPDAEGEQVGDEATEPTVEAETPVVAELRAPDFLDTDARARKWARDAVLLAGLAPKKGKRESDSEYQGRVDAEANRLIKRIIAHGEFYLVRAGNTRKGTGTFYTRPQLAVPTVHRTLEPLCYDKAADGTLTPKPPETILGLKVCDSACGSASFLVASLHYLTDALYNSLRHHREIEDPDRAQRLTLPYGRKRTGAAGEELVPFPPNDPHRGHMFPDRVKAILRRHVVERCLYGVDINPLAVEFARVSLWIETLDAELPFSFLDHKIKVGNSLVGCWLDRVADYPIKAWERNGGDDPDAKHNGPRSERIETLLKGEKIGNRRSGDGRIKKEMRELIESRFSNQAPLFPDMQVTAVDVVGEARQAYERLHELPLYEPDEREQAYRRIEHDPAVTRLKQAMDEWCAVWFWPMDEASAKCVPTPLAFHAEQDAKDAIVRRLAGELHFFHWELEYPDAFTPQRSGFDAVVGNPPWDVMKANSQEFFTEYDPIYRTYDKQTALREQRELFTADDSIKPKWDEYNALFKALSNWAKNVAEPFDLALDRGQRGETLAAQWAAHQQQQSGFALATHPFRLQGSADLNSYKMFAEVFWCGLQVDGRVGVILPTGIYSDFGTKVLREELLFKGRLDLLYAFQNEKRVFSAAHHSVKQVAVFATKGGQTQSFLARFRMGVGDSPKAHDIPEDILRRDSAAMTFTPDDLRLNSPNALGLLELRTPRDKMIFGKVYLNSSRIGDNTPGWEVRYTREFDMTNDSRLFPPLEKWVAKGFVPDDFGRWIGPNRDRAVPLGEGRMVGQHDFSQKGWVSGKGRTAVWEPMPFEQKAIRPQYLMSLDDFEHSEGAVHGLKIAMMDVTAATNTRTMVATATRGVPFGHSAPVLSLPHCKCENTLSLAGVLNSFVFDYVARPRVGGVHFTWFTLEECPIPFGGANTKTSIPVGLPADVGRLTLIHRQFAPDWLRLKHLYPSLAEREWKQWWAVTEADRLRLRVEIDAICADLYGLEPDDFDWIVRDDPTDPKGFYRVDRGLPFRERLTGLAAAAFRALKEGKWSAESAAGMSNDEFFETVGIPEMTNPEAARAAGLDEVLIRKRQGCHAWHPERFTPDDPRYGWTWEHCRNDAVALLGSEEAVERYVAGADIPASSDGHEPSGDGHEPSGDGQAPAKGKKGERFRLRSEEHQPGLFE